MFDGEVCGSDDRYALYSDRSHQISNINDGDSCIWVARGEGVGLLPPKELNQQGFEYGIIPGVCVKIFNGILDKRYVDHLGHGLVKIARRQPGRHILRRISLASLEIRFNDF